jgi:hypothetical protein
VYVPTVIREEKPNVHFINRQPSPTNIVSKEDSDIDRCDEDDFNDRVGTN